jgi:threonine aldolase
VLARKNLASDNYAPVHPKVIEAINRVNIGTEPAYGADSETEKLQETVKTIFGKNASAFPVLNGTAANVLALEAALPKWGAVICIETAHLNLDEGGAPEKVAGMKLWNVPNIHGNGKLTPEMVQPELRDVGFVHRAQQGAITITNSTEYGTVYSPDEVKGLAKLAKSHSLVMHLDGARIANAAAALDSSISSFTSVAGVDIVSLGGTKIGGLLAEAVVVTDVTSDTGGAIAEALPYIRKTNMQLGSKMRYLSAQLNALYGTGLAIELAKIANSMAKLLQAGISEIADGERLVMDLACEANALFPVMDPKLASKLRENWAFYDWDTGGRVRLMCAWNTSEDDVSAFISDLREAMSF